MRILDYIEYMRNKNKLVCGVGINDYEGDVRINRIAMKSYGTWKSMLERCYSIVSYKVRPTYIDCLVCDEWLLFSNFKQWFDENYIEGFDLDKDILVEGNKVYSPDTCRFVPHYINSLVLNSRASRCEMPIGVFKKLSKGQINPTYTACCRIGTSRNKLSKTFKTIEEASAWYSETKKRIVKEQAQRAFLENAIKTDVYLALISRNF